MAVQLCRVVVAQPFRIQSQLEITFRGDEGPAGLGHLLAVHRQKAVGIDRVGRLVAGAIQHRRPEQGMKVKNILANEVNHLVVLAGEELVEVDAFPGAVVPEAGEISNGRIQPDVEIFARCIGDLETEVRRVAGDVPVGKFALLLVAKPLIHLVECLRLQMARGAGPLAKEIGALGQLEEIVLGFFPHRGGTGDD